MPLVILHNETHQKLKVDTKAAANYGDYVNRAMVYTTEFAELHKEFPILIVNNPETKEITAHAIMGLERDENLFVDGERWTSAYMPATIARGPFSIAYQNQVVNGEQQTNTLIMVDEDSPRIQDNGVDVFLEFGGETPYLQFIKKVLSVIDAGHRNDELFYKTLVEMDLLEPVDINISINVDKHYNFKDYQTISQDKVAKLTGKQLVKLRDMGILPQIYFLLSSLGNFQRLIDRKNAK